VVFNKRVIISETYKAFWRSIEEQPDKLSIVQKYEIGLTKSLRQAGFRFKVLVPYRRIWGLKAFAGKLKEKLFGRPSNQAGAAQPTAQRKRRTLKGFVNLFSKAFRLIANPTHYCWRETIKEGSPFIKVDLLRDNQFKVDIDNWERFLVTRTKYTIALVRQHLLNLKSR
jgi:rhamnosyltransferase